MEQDRRPTPPKLPTSDGAPDPFYIVVVIIVILIVIRIISAVKRSISSNPSSAILL